MFNVRHLLASRAADWLVRAVVITSVVVSSFAAWQVRNLTTCVADYNNANNERSVILTVATNEERAAERHADDAQAALFLNPAVSKPTEQRTTAERAEITRLFRAYQTALSDQKTERAAADDARVDHPIPDPPSEVCG